MMTQGIENALVILWKISGERPMKGFTKSVKPNDSTKGFSGVVGYPTDHPVVLSVYLQDLWNPHGTFSPLSSLDMKILMRKQVGGLKRGACVVIKAEMNDGFKGCGTDRLDDRGAEGPPPI